MKGNHRNTEPTAKKPFFWKNGKRFIRLYYFMPEEHFLDVVCNDEIKVSLPSKCNDPQEFLMAKAASIEERHQKYGFISLCSHLDSSLMWSHYADSHKGVCIQFDFPVKQVGKLSKRVEDCFESIVKNEKYIPREEDVLSRFAIIDIHDEMTKSQLFRVRQLGNAVPVLVEIYYSQNRPSIDQKEDFSVSQGDEIISLGIPACYYTKSTEWKYEKEWRLFVELENALSFHDNAFFIRGLTQYITNIIIGSKFSKETAIAKTFITSAAKQTPNAKGKELLSDCPVCKASYDPELYKILIN